MSDTNNKKVRVRFAPSPTGALHIGGGHTALFNWLLARHTDGVFILRIEDTDLERSTKEYEQTIMEGMRWLGLEWDEGPDKGGAFGPYRQSERLELYRKYAEQLVSEGKAYKEENAIIFKVERGIDTSFDDVVYGRIECASDGLQKMGSDELKDVVMIKGDGMPTYNYACVIDDHLMEISHVIRGEDHISNTPKQILIYKALGWQPPLFAHLPMILGKDKKKLSKRHGATSVYEYRDMGYMPESVFNFLALLGWSPASASNSAEGEIFTREEAVPLFDIGRVIRKPSVFDFDKLNHINQAHLKRLPPMERLAMIKPFWIEMGLPVGEKSDEFLADALTLMDGRGKTAKEMAEFSDYFVSFEPVKTRYDASDVGEEQKNNLRAFCNAIFAVADWKASALEEAARLWTEQSGVKMKDCAMPVRVAITGLKVSPGIFEVAELMGRDETKKRLEHYGFHLTPCPSP